MIIANAIQQQSNKLIRYCMVGMLNTVVTLTIIAILAAMQINYIIYTAIGYMIGMSLSFVLNLIFTFKVTGKLKQRIIKFFIINIFNLGVVELLQIFLIEYQHVHHSYAVIAGLLWYAVFGFIMNQFLTFKQSKHQNQYA